ncbi:MAG: A24 family peptidase [Pseudomonadota bacterium]|nr:A24 family peptidase [Pseudomonadota bacterium]
MLVGAAVFVLGLLIGSFLNVVIYRLPKMMESAWQAQCQALLNASAPPDANTAETAFNLVWPNSHCPDCHAPVRAWQNIPVLSYLLLRGRCACCGTAISKRYPAIELTAASLGLATAVALPGANLWVIAWALVFSWCLLTLSVIDLDHQLLPDNITLPLLWLGLGLNQFEVFAALDDAVWGAVAGYGSLWLFYWAFKLVTGKEGMGHGDFKLLGAVGAWLGWQALPLVVILSSLIGAATGVGLIALRGRARSAPIPFGPFLAAAAWVALLWGEDLTQAYLRFAGLA